MVILEPESLKNVFQPNIWGKGACIINFSRQYFNVVLVFLVSLQNNQKVGIGSGSTVIYAVQRLGKNFFFLLPEEKKRTHTWICTCWYFSQLINQVFLDQLQPLGSKHQTCNLGPWYPKGKWWPLLIWRSQDQGSNKSGHRKMTTK